MEDILVKLSDYARERVRLSKERVSFEEIKRKASEMPNPPSSFFEAVRKDGLSFICEVKKASPSKGIIAEEFSYIDIAMEYDKAGADAISVLTEPKWFLGSEKYLEEISRRVNIPVLRKDFTVDPYMIYEAKTIGASAILLICSLLDKATLKDYIEIAESIGLAALVEAHDEKEIEDALDTGAKIIGVNNRNLRDFSVDTGNAKRLRSMVPKDVMFVSESGIVNEADIRMAKESGADAVLIGEAMMRAYNKAEFLNNLRNA